MCVCVCVFSCVSLSELCFTCSHGGDKGQGDWQLAGSLGLRDLVYMTPAQGPKTSECANQSDSELRESDT